MKLLFVIKRLHNASGGSERVLATISSGLAEAGHDVAIATWDAPGQESFYPLNRKIRFLPRGLGDTSRPSGLLATLRRMGDLRRLAEGEAPDIVIGFGHPAFVPLAFALLGKGIPLVGSEHAAMPHYRGRRFEYLLIRLSAPLLAAITVLSEPIKRGYTPDVRGKMHVVPNPIMLPNRIRNRKAEGAARLLLNVGRLDPQKDQMTLLRAFALVAADFPEWRLRIIGEGPLRADLEAEIARLGLQARVDLPGATSAIAEEYASADLFALSSAYESFGLVSIEAMANGLAVVGFADCPGTNEIITSGKDGLLVAGGPDRVMSFAAGLRNAMADAALRERLGGAARQSVEARAAGCQALAAWMSLLRLVKAGA